MFSLLRVSRQLVPGHARILSTHNVIASLPARRTFVNSAVLSEPTAKATLAKKPAAKSPTKAAAKTGPTAKKPVKKAVKAKPKKIVKKVVKKAVKKPVKKQKPTIPESLRPPKAPLSSYLIFTQKFREQRSHGDQPKLTTTEFAKAAGEAWRALGEDTKQVFKDDAAAQRQKYHMDLTEWVATVNPADMRYIHKNRKALKITKLAGVERLKKPLTAYFRFIRDYRATPDGQALLQSCKTLEKPNALPQFTKILAERWRALSESQKEAFKGDYARELAEYKQTLAKAEETAVHGSSAS